MRHNVKALSKYTQYSPQIPLGWLTALLVCAIPSLGFSQTTYYLTTGTSNPQSGSITYYDLSTTAGGASNGLYPSDPNQTALDYAAEGSAGTYNYNIVPGIVMGSPESSTSVVTTSTGYGWETANPLACDISAGTWTFSNRFEGNIGSGSPSVYVEVSAYVYNGTTSSLLFNYSDTTNIAPSLNPSSGYTYSFTTNQAAFSGIAGQSLKVEYYAQLVDGASYAGGFIYLGYNTSTDFVTVPVCPPPTNTSTNTATNTVTNTATNTATNTSTNTSTDTSTSTSTNTATNTPTNTSTDTSSSTATNTTTNTSTDTATSTNTDTSTSTDTAINTYTPTNTPTNTLTNTSTNTTTSTATNTTLNTSTQTNTATNTLTNTSTNTATATGTQTATNTATNTSTSISTNTCTATMTSTTTSTATKTNTLTIASTATSTFTPTNTPTVTNTVTPNIHPPVIIYPNPYSGSGPVNIDVPLDVQGDVKVAIFSLAFRKVQEMDFPNSLPGIAIQINLLDKNGYELANGLYYVRIKTAIGTNLLKLLILR